MAVTTIPLTSIPPHDLVYLSNSGSQVISASTHIVAFLVQAPKSGTLDGIRFRTGTVTTGDTVRVSFQSVDTATGNPSGTAAQYRNVTINSTDDNVAFTTGLITDDGTDTGVKRTVTQGDFFFVCFDFPSYVAGNLAISNSSVQNQSQAYQTYYNGATWTKSTTVGALLLVYTTDGIVFTHTNVLTSNVTSGTTASNSTPDERANKFQLPVSVRACGIHPRVDIDGNCDFVLYDSDGTTVLASVSIDSDSRAGTSVAEHYLYFTSSVTLSANTNYYLSIKPTTTTAIGWRSMTLFVSGDRAGLAFGSNWQGSSRTDAGAWTDDPTQVYAIGILIDGIETGGGGGTRMVNIRGGSDQ